MAESRLVVNASDPDTMAELAWINGWPAPQQLLGLPPCKVAVARLRFRRALDVGRTFDVPALDGALLARLAPRSSGLDYGCGPGPALAAMLREEMNSLGLGYDDRYDGPEKIDG
mgnify:CR=1 FL=1